MATNLCSICNTELIDQLICCSGRCKLYYHYTCIGMSRTIFDGFKKVCGLRWHCTNCTNEFEGIWTKLDDLAVAVNDIKSMITLTGLVKAAVDDAFKCRVSSPIQPTPLTNVSHDSCLKVKKKQKKKKKKDNNVNKNVNSRNAVRNPDSSNKKSDYSTSPIRLDEHLQNDDTGLQTCPVNSSSPNASTATLDLTIIENVQSIPLPSQDLSVSNPGHGIRVADKRTYICLSGFHHTTTTQQVVLFVSRVLSVNEKEIVCRSLKSSRRTYSDFQHVSFRIGLRTTYANEALQPNKWPAGISCKLFDQKN